MIVVRVELWSAVTGARTELARLSIANEGEAPARTRGTYVGASYIGRDQAALDRAMRFGRISKRGRVENHARLGEHVWNLVAKMLASMGYGPR